MSTVNPGGIVDPVAPTGTDTGSAAAAFAADPAGAISDPGNILAFTGSGPGTLLLTLVGVLSLVLGGALAAFGVKRKTKVDAELPDLSHLAESGV
jgi:hypothetical protein